MKFFIDTANIDEIREAAKLGIIDGVTTNPSLIAKEGRKLIDVIVEITGLIDGPISAEVKESTVESMLAEAKYFAGVHPNIVIKVPMTLDGIRLTGILSKLGIKTNVTLVFSVAQAMMAAKAGATYVSPFMGRLDDFLGKQDAGYELIDDIRYAFDNFGYDTQIIAASIRHPLHVEQAALAGSHVATIPFKVLNEMVKHPLTEKGLEIFRKAAESK